MGDCDFVGYGYAAFLAIGGATGYYRAGSTASLASGLAFGALSGYGAHLASKDPKNCLLLFGSASALTCLMDYRWYKTRKYIPSGLVASVSFLVALRYGLRLYRG